MGQFELCPAAPHRRASAISLDGAGPPERVRGKSTWARWLTQWTHACLETDQAGVLGLVAPFNAPERWVGAYGSQPRRRGTMADLNERDSKLVQWLNEAHAKEAELE